MATCTCCLEKEAASRQKRYRQNPAPYLKANHERYAWLKQMGFCVTCGHEKARPGRVECEEKEECDTKSERIPKEVYLKVSRIVRTYGYWVRQLREAEREILHAGSSPSDGLPRGSGTGNPTAAKAEKLIERKAEAERNLQAIRAAYEDLPDRETRLLIRKNLFEHIRMTDIPVHMSEATMKRVRSEYIRCVAKYLGLV